ncbi:MAG TPA: hypothetical protein VNI58_06650 [Mariprofundaceae bacterium]|nr:hypothetical protein [Mariprofundaceae bacterium]
MSRFQRLFTCFVLSILGCVALPALSLAVTNSSNVLLVESFQVVKEPQSCNSTLIARVRNNGSAATDSGLFLHADQYRSLGGTLRSSTMLPALRVPVLAPGQAADVSFTFVRESDKTNVNFVFMVGPNTVATADGPLPPFTESYAAVIASHQLDRAANEVRGTVSNTGSYPIPRPSVTLYVARQSAPTSFSPSGGSMVSSCLMPGDTVPFTRMLTDATTVAAYRLQLFAAGKTLDQKTAGQTTPKSGGVLRPKPHMGTKPILPPRQ